MAEVTLITGKGGVGKTTVASALALEYAAPGEPVLLVSTDPTGALAEVFGGVSDRQREVRPGLFAVELTRRVVLERWRERFGEEIYQVLRALLPVERDILDYIEGVPGIEEEFMLTYLLEAADSRRYSRIIWDAAPTAGTLALLRAQELFYAHLTQAQKLYLKMRGYLQGADPSALIEGWLELTRRILELLRGRTAAWVVAHPERLAVVQGLELIEQLAGFGIPTERAVLNRVLPADGCPDCRFYAGKLARQEKWADHWRQRSPARVTVLPELAGEASSLEALRRLAALLLEEGDGSKDA
ncbi:ArsA family ATPase [Oceanithermus sp.]